MVDVLEAMVGVWEVGKCGRASLTAKFKTIAQSPAVVPVSRPSAEARCRLALDQQAESLEALP